MIIKNMVSNYRTCGNLTPIQKKYKINKININKKNRNKQNE